MAAKQDQVSHMRGRRPTTMRDGAAAAVAVAIRAGVKSYDRVRDLPGLIRSDPFGPVPESAAETAAIVKRLERALRAERTRARSGHWTYDLNRHIALCQALGAETERLAALQAVRK